MTQKAALRVCASCEWIFSGERHAETGGCPKCGWAHYGAHFVFGRNAYRHAVSQKPWLRNRMAKRAEELHREIAATNEFPRSSPETVKMSELPGVGMGWLMGLEPTRAVPRYSPDSPHAR